MSSCRPVQLCFSPTTTPHADISLFSPSSEFHLHFLLHKRWENDPPVGYVEWGRLEMNEPETFQNKIIVKAVLLTHIQKLWMYHTTEESQQQIKNMSRNQNVLVDFIDDLIQLFSAFQV